MASSETTLIAVRPSRILFLKYYVVAVLFLFLIFFLWFFDFLIPGLSIISRTAIKLWGTAVLGFLALVLVLVAELKRLATKYVVTDFRVIRMDGILRKSENVMPYNKLERVQLTQGLVERILGIGTLVVDTGEDQMLIASVRNPRNVERAIMGRMQRTVR